MEKHKKQRRILVVGEVGAGKTTLIQTVLKGVESVPKTQAPVYWDCFVDTPGEYFQNPHYRRNLLSLAQGCSNVLFIQDCTKPMSAFPPDFAHGFLVPVIGIVTKADLGCRDDYQRAERWLRQAGARNIYVVSAVTGFGLKRLKDELFVRQENRNRTVTEQFDCHVSKS